MHPTLVAYIDSLRRRIHVASHDTLVRQMAQNGDTGRRKVVKIDVEGAEWSALLQTPDEVLDSIDQMPMELHGVHEQRMVDVVRKLKRT